MLAHTNTRGERQGPGGFLNQQSPSNRDRDGTAGPSFRSLKDQHQLISSTTDQRFTHLCAAPAMVLDSWNFRALCQVGSVLPKALATGDVSGTGESEFLIGTSEGAFMILRHNCREPLIKCTTLTTVSVVLWEPNLKCLIIVCLEGTCHALLNFNTKTPVEYFQRASTTIPSNCSCGVVCGERLFLGSSNRRVYAYTISASSTAPQTSSGTPSVSGVATQSSNRANSSIATNSSVGEVKPMFSVADPMTAIPATLKECGDYFINSPVFSISLFFKCGEPLLLVATTSGVAMLHVDAQTLSQWELSTDDPNSSLKNSLWHLDLTDARIRMNQFGTPGSANRHSLFMGEERRPVEGGAPSKAFEERRLPIAVDCCEVDARTTVILVASEDGFISWYTVEEEERDDAMDRLAKDGPMRAKPKGTSGAGDLGGQNQHEWRCGTANGKVHLHIRRFWETRLEALIQRVVVSKLGNSVIGVACTTSGVLHIFDRQLNVITSDVSTEMISICDKSDDVSSRDRPSELTLVCAALDEVFEVTVPLKNLGVNGAVSRDASAALRDIVSDGEEFEPTDVVPNSSLEDPIFLHMLRQIGFEGDFPEVLELLDELMPMTGDELAGIQANRALLILINRNRLQNLMAMLREVGSREDWDTLRASLKSDEGARAAEDFHGDIEMT